MVSKLDTDKWERPPSIPDIAARFRWARKRLGWTQHDLAQNAGVTVDVIKKVEAHRTHRPRRIEQIAKALQVSPGWLAHNAAELDSLESWAITAAIQLQALTDADRQAVLAHISALHRTK